MHTRVPSTLTCVSVVYTGGPPSYVLSKLSMGCMQILLFFKDYFHSSTPELKYLFRTSWDQCFMVHLIENNLNTLLFSPLNYLFAAHATSIHLYDRL